MMSVCDVPFLQFTWVVGEGEGEEGVGVEDGGEEDRDVRSSSSPGTLTRNKVHYITITSFMTCYQNQILLLFCPLYFPFLWFLNVF